MIQKLSDILVLSDMDGTLLSSKKKISRSDLETIRLFTMLGGHFGVATGRLPQSVKRYEKLMGCVGPSITCGGAVIYDFAHDVSLKNSFLPRSAAKKALREILRNFPHVGAVVMTRDNVVYQVKASAQTQKLLHDEQLTYYLRPREELPDDWNKVLFAGTPDALEEVEDFVSRQVYPGIYYVATDPHYFEMMPQGVSKGAAMKVLSGMMDIPLENIYVIGDYYNDIDMMKTAGHAVAMENAPREVKILADETTGSNEEGGVGQFLYRLIRQYG